MRREQPQDTMNIEALRRQIDHPCFDELCSFISQEYHVKPVLDYSRCTMLPGYNLKFRKSGRSLCTLYPKEGSFSVLIVIGRKQLEAFDLLFDSLSPTVREAYLRTEEFNGTRWLMIDVTDAHVLKDVKDLIALRMKYK